MDYFGNRQYSRTMKRLPTLLAVLLVSFALFTSLPKPIATASHTDDPGPAQLVVGAPYRQTNLVSDLPGVALVEDRLLRGPWGVATTANSPFWVVNNKTDSASIYTGDVGGAPLVRNRVPSIPILNVPTLLPAPTLPTAVVANTTNDFLVRFDQSLPPPPTTFIFATRNGGINAFPMFETAAVPVHFNSGHDYTGIAIGTNANGNFLYVADFTNGHIDIFDRDFNPSSVTGNFTDPSVPANFHPFNIQNLGGSLYVTYAEFQHAFNSDRGFVRKFDTNGVRDMAFKIDNGPLVAPWGIAISPANFGGFSNALLVGNSRLLGIPDDSCISAFNPTTGALIGSMVDEGGSGLQIDQLRALIFGNGVNGGDPNTLYFSAGSPPFLIEQHGLFGSLKPASIATSTIKFSDRQFFTRENDGHIDITVVRTGDTSGVATVNYATVDRNATQKSNYEISLGKLTFNSGETSKTFRVLIVDNSEIGGGSSRDLALVLSNATGASLVDPDQATLFIMDDEGDTPRQPPNLIDDTSFFVRQQYFDFLNREPDAAGFNFWRNEINSCGANPQCIEIKRINVSAAFFLSIEFQRTGMIAYLTEKAAFGGLPTYGAFMGDVQALQKDFVFGQPGAATQLENNKQSFFNEFVTRPEFVARYSGLTNSQFVATLYENAGISRTIAELYIAKLTGAQVVPPTNSTATGLVILRQAVNGPTVSVSLYLNGLSSNQTLAHLHGPAAASANGDIIATLPNGQFLDFQVPFTTAQFNNLSAGLLYVDVHTGNFPDGEIRAQLPRNLFDPDMIVVALDAGIITRAQALRLVAESERFRTNEFSRAFVLMEYFGYLRRNPDDLPDTNLSGFNFWLGKLNQFDGSFIRAELVKAFLISSEYRSRFGPP
jgi:uncharacterized protein (TIGR03118 family)